MWSYYTGFLNLYIRPTTAKEAKEKGCTKYCTGKPCKHGHVYFRQASTHECFICSRARCARYEKANKETLRRKRAEYRDTNRTAINERQRAERRKNGCSSQSRYKAKNMHKYAAWAAKRRAAKLERTPPWVDWEKIDEIFSIAETRTLETDVKHEVDHVIPLQGKLVSGLHVHTNLQVITKKANNEKINKFDPMTFEC